MFKYVLPVVIVFSIFTACNGDEKEPVNPPKKLTDGQPKFVKEGELTFLDAQNNPIVKLDIEIAATEPEQQQGLMYRSFMRNDQGMLFIFGADEPRAFWMRNTIIPLDIIYVNSKMEIVSIAQDTQPYSEASIPSKGPAMYVVEVNSGFSVQYGLKPGVKMQFSQI